jgi:hypothetical protein
MNTAARNLTARLGRKATNAEAAGLKKVRNDGQNEISYIQGLIQQDEEKSFKKALKKKGVTMKAPTSPKRNNFLEQLKLLNKKAFNRRTKKKVPENVVLITPPPTPPNMRTNMRAKKTTQKKTVAKTPPTPHATPNQALNANKNRPMMNLSNALKKLERTAKLRVTLAKKSTNNMSKKESKKKMSTAEKEEKRLEREYNKEMRKINREITRNEKKAAKAAKKEVAEAKKASRKVRRPSAATCALCEKIKAENISQ